MARRGGYGGRVADRRRIRGRQRHGGLLARIEKGDVHVIDMDTSVHASKVTPRTNNETWAGRSHPTQALAAYRRTVNPDVRVVVAAMTAVGYTIGDPQDDGVLNVAGLGGSLPLIVNGFVRS